MNDEEQFDGNQSGLIFYAKVPKLQTLASSRIALFVWRAEIIDLSLRAEIPPWNVVGEKFHAENAAKIPTSIRSLIVDRIRFICFKLQLWMSRAYDGLHRLMLARNHDTWIKYFDDFVWNVDYTIDYPKTCQNLLRSDRLSDEEKFKMACQYCLEKDIEQLWTRVQSEVDSWRYPRLWLLTYWINRMRNRHPGGRISDTFDERDLLSNMTRKCRNRYATEYFWPHLSFDARVGHVLSIISAEDSICMKFLLPKLDESSLNVEGPFIMQTLISSVKCRPLAIPFWNHVKNIFHQHKFYELVKWFLISEVWPDSSKFCRKQRLICKHIWTSAAEKLKEHVFNRILVDNSALKSRWFGGEPYRNVEIFKMIISEATSELRCQIWQKNWLKVCIGAKCSDINELMELCLQDATERSNFKRNVMMKVEDVDSRRYCFFLLDGLEFDKFDEFLKICSIDADAFARLKRGLLKSYFLNNGCSRRYYRRADDFSKFIDDSFVDTELNVSFKKEIAMSRFFFDCMWDAFLYSEDFDAIRNLVAIFLFSEEDVREWKEEFNSYCGSFLSRGMFCQFDPSQWQNFMIWCLGTEERVLEFKQTLNVKEVFDVFLEKCTGDGGIEQNHKVFDNFLRWRFENEEEVVAFKNVIARANPDFDEIHWLLFGKRRRSDSIDSSAESN